jgi:hypothetical protein
MLRVYASRYISSKSSVRYVDTLIVRELVRQNCSIYYAARSVAPHSIPACHHVENGKLQP